MDPSKLADKNDLTTTSRKGNKYKYTLAAPGIHIYDNVWGGGLDFMKTLDSEGKFEREDYLFDAEGNAIPKEVGKQGVSTWIKSPRDGDRDPLLCDQFEDVIDSYLWHYDLDPQSREWWRISKFAVGDYFGMHPDDSYGTPRTVSMVYYPNDDYEGGELEFIHFNVKLKPKAGQLFLFPSAYIYEHRISDIGEGNPRYTIVAFFSNISTDEKESRLKDLPTPYKANLQYIRDLNA
jgi:hypothetical protein